MAGQRVANDSKIFFGKTFNRLNAQSDANLLIVLPIFKRLHLY